MYCYLFLVNEKLRFKPKVFIFCVEAVQGAAQQH